RGTICARFPRRCWTKPRLRHSVTARSSRIALALETGLSTRRSPAPSTLLIPDFQPPKTVAVIHRASLPSFWPSTVNGQRSTIILDEPDNIILPQISSRLHFDDVQRDLAGILDAVFDAQRNERRLVL